jgi:hypothetical protein
MVLSEKSATFRDHALVVRPAPPLRQRRGLTCPNIWKPNVGVRPPAPFDCTGPFVPFSIGKRLPRIADSCHEIPGKPVVSPEAGFDGEMMARGAATTRSSYPEYPECAPSAVRQRTGGDARRLAPAAPVLGKTATARAFRRGIPLRSAACWGSEESRGVPKRGGYGSSWQRRA